MQQTTLKEYNAELKELNTTTDKSKFKCLEFVNTTTYTKHQCLNCKHIFLAQPKVIKKGKHCPNCGPVKNQKMDHDAYLNKLNLINSEKHRKILPKETFVNTTTKIKHKCYTCKHNWLVTPKDLLNGNGCPNCYKLNNPKKFTNKEYIEKVKELNKLTGYKIKPLEKYKGSNINLLHECGVCNNKWHTRPNAILKGSNCPVCAVNNLTSTVEEKIKQLPKEVTNKYTVLNNLSDRLGHSGLIKTQCIKCSTVKEVKYCTLLSNPICQECEIAARTNSFIRASRKRFGNVLDYSKVRLTNLENKVTLTCLIHGDFEIKGTGHLAAKHPCKACAREHLSTLYSDTTESFIEKAKLKHKNKYSYDKVNYTSSKSKVIVTCKKHGDWNAEPNAHLNGHGCPKCSHHISKPETKLSKWLQKKNIVVELNRRDLLNGQKELDIYLPDYNLAIEVNGIFWHSEKYSGQTSHVDKSEVAFSKGIDLLHFWETEVNEKFSLVKSIIKHKLGLSTRYYARDFVCKELIDKQLVKDFLNNNHLQGNNGYKIAYGLFYNDKLYSVITLGKPKHTRKEQYDWELIRYATKKNCVVIGGASRLITNFRKQYSGSIISFADNRYSVGNVYSQCGFDYKGISKPNYFYVKGSKILSRNVCQKHKLEKLLPVFNSNLSEYENMVANNYHRTYDAGHHRYVLF
jgi:predicted  nucleic acid-binding Zn-ribbon protein